MQVQAYEHPVKTGTRRVLRQIFLAWALASAGMFLLVGERNWVPGSIPLCLFYGFIPGLVLWLLYRLVRFAIGR
jgi:hypothetical protein